MKKAKILFWISTGIIFLFEGVLVAFTSNSQMAIDGITHLGYPVYFVTLLGVFKVIGSIVLVLPKASSRVKEWAYAGFGIDFVSALISILVVDGLGPEIILPVVFIGLLVVSYTNYHKLKGQ